MSPSATAPSTNGAVNGNHHEPAINGQEGDGQRPLRVVVAGAGIGGLAAALALRRQGHDVTVYEQSQLAQELGAAIHIAPNANGIIKRLGIDESTLGANPMNHLTEYTAAGEETKSIDLRKANEQWQHPWLLAHRVSLHSSLRAKATSATGPGKPVVLHTGSKVTASDPETGTITLQSGEKVQADVIVGADGVHSALRLNGLGHDAKPFSSGKSAYRFLIQRKDALADPKCAKFVKTNGNLVIWYGSDRRVVMYPCKDNQVLNFVCIHPEALSGPSEDAWNTQGNKQKFLNIYKDFDPHMLALIDKADVDTLKVWTLLDMDVLPSWVKSRLALLGDAAHPFLPHQGQGGGVAIEDAASLAVCLRKPVNPEDIPARLQLYERCRKERADRIQQYTRDVGLVGEPGAKHIDMMEYTNYNFGHDEWDHSTQKLKEWLVETNPRLYWRMPIGFGPMPGPRQTHYGQFRPSIQSTFRTASIKFKTSRTLLQTLFPSPSFSFISPGTVARASFSATTLDKMDWLGGNGYNHIGLYIHGVQYMKKDGTVLKGTHLPILFESLTDPIVSGREELGMPKLFCNVDIHDRANSYRLETSWRAARFGDFLLEGLEKVDPASEGGTIGGEDDDGILAYKYIPGTGFEARNRKHADADYAVFVPHAVDRAIVPSTVNAVYKAKKAHFEFKGLDWGALPTLHHVASFLAEIPVYEVIEGKLVEGTGVPNVSAASRIE